MRRPPLLDINHLDLGFRKCWSFCDHLLDHVLIIWVPQVTFGVFEKNIITLKRNQIDHILMVKGDQGVWNVIYGTKYFFVGMMSPLQIENSPYSINVVEIDINPKINEHFVLMTNPWISNWQSFQSLFVLCLHFHTFVTSFSYWLPFDHFLFRFVTSCIW